MAVMALERAVAHAVVPHVGPEPPLKIGDRDPGGDRQRPPAGQRRRRRSTGALHVLRFDGDDRPFGSEPWADFALDS